MLINVNAINAKAVKLINLIVRCIMNPPNATGLVIAANKGIKPIPFSHA